MLPENLSKNSFPEVRGNRWSHWVGSQGPEGEHGPGSRLGYRPGQGALLLSRLLTLGCVPIQASSGPTGGRCRRRDLRPGAHRRSPRRATVMLFDVCRAGVVVHWVLCFRARPARSPCSAPCRGKQLKVGERSWRIHQFFRLRTELQPELTSSSLRLSLFRCGGCQREEGSEALNSPYIRAVYNSIEKMGVPLRPLCPDVSVKVWKRKMTPKKEDM